ncbi:MAG: hypothetical protein ABS81_04680 [Pseudonocardia sp. SCN 72-86]|nr:MAG: hypothetical protein ABS81_04680 [Pseudonocardia sp. SCN 72-86]
MAGTALVAVGALPAAAGPGRRPLVQALTALGGAGLLLRRALLEAVEETFTGHGLALATPHLTVRAEFSPAKGDG